MSGRNFSRLCLRFFPDVSVDNLLKCLQGRVMPLLWRRASFSPLLLIRTAFICLITAIPLSAFTKKRPKPNKLGTNCCNLLSSTSWKDQAFFLRIKLPETKLTDLFFFFETYYYKLHIVDQLKLIILLYFIYILTRETHINVIMSVTASRCTIY